MVYRQTPTFLNLVLTVSCVASWCTVMKIRRRSSASRFTSLGKAARADMGSGGSWTLLDSEDGSASSDGLGRPLGSCMFWCRLLVRSTRFYGFQVQHSAVTKYGYDDCFMASYSQMFARVSVFV